MNRPQEVAALAARLEQTIGSVYVGKKDAVRAILLGLFSGLHVLIEDIPGVGKTTLSHTFARSTGLDFGRIQFTPDLLPGDIVGMTVWSPEKREFIFKPGAIMHQFILADEINRASARTQSSLLEAMQEGSVTVDGVSYRLKSPFFVMATQNPISFAGTFVLPESQLDRFGICLSLGYPTPQDESIILERFRAENPMFDVTPVTTPQQIERTRDLIMQVRVDEKIRRYITTIADATRRNERIRLGMSPRSSLHLMRASQARACMQGRNYVVPEDVMDTAAYVLSHRLMMTAEASMEDVSAGAVLADIIRAVAKPSRV
ncbi:MAG: MoxR family ATPase [Spirochaetaceae bacterium]|nr:MAG: MoxR family ATPase [Spirochaetaceae bacterium]